MATVPQFPTGTLSRSALNNFVTETTTNLTDTNIAAGAGIQISKTTLGTYTAPTTYTPAWATSGTQPAIGNGSLGGRYMQIGKIVWCNINLSWGSTTTGGTGDFTFTLPVTAEGTSSTGSVRGLDSGVGYHTGVATKLSATTIGIYTEGGGGGWTFAYPQPWAVNDTIIITIVYEAA